MLENMFIWNVLPPCLATVGAIALVLTVSGPMAALLVVVAAVVVVTMFRLAAAGKPLHFDFADKTAAVDGEMIDVIGNMEKTTRIERLSPCHGIIRSVLYERSRQWRRHSHRRRTYCR